jgi:hypothetical protein
MWSAQGFMAAALAWMRACRRMSFTPPLRTSSSNVYAAAPRLRLRVNASALARCTGPVAFVPIKPSQTGRWRCHSGHGPPQLDALRQARGSPTGRERKELPAVSNTFGTCRGTQSLLLQPCCAPLDVDGPWSVAA